jgi:hypothetical protein
MNVVLHIDVSLESEMRLGSTFLRPSLFVLYYLKLDGKFQQVREEVNQLPTEAYANYQSLRPLSKFLATVFVLVSVIDKQVYVYLFVCLYFSVFDFRCILDANVGCY